MPNSAPDIYEFIIHNCTEDISAAIENLLRFSKEKKYSLAIIYKLRLVLEEILVNTVSYSYKDDIIHDIGIKLQQVDGNVILQFTDDGIAFNPLSIPDPKDVPLEERKPGGVGVYLVKTLMDFVDYQRVDGKNILTVSKKIT